MNLKKYYRNLLSNSTDLTALVDAGNIVSAYPNEVTVFPLVVYEDSDARDVAYSDNLPNGTTARVRVHIFTKTLSGYPTTGQIGEIIHGLFRADYWHCSMNGETADVDDSVRHRVMVFTRSFYSL